MRESIVFLGVLALFVVLFLLAIKKSCSCREGYRDPIYLNRAKLVYDWYPRANGDIYGMPIPYGSWNLMSGFPYYPKAY